ncbi:GNAT family protein [Rhodanobacter sp. PCA2]|uniref:GNAT family N-acetyltransferase n=1 Tax=Rhodanobacter sp. PCA2 TaxID=2006117 RepID=UPI0021052C67|nr:GNAT family protein [Rhodanobacter sp. PCA2]
MLPLPRDAEPMELVTARLRLDALRPDDAEALFGYRADPAVCRYQNWRPSMLAEARRFIDSQAALAAPVAGEWFQRAIRRRDDGALVGDLGFCIADAQAEFGITLAPAAQGVGYARETLHALFGWLFGEMGVHRVHASVDPRNAPSMALMRAMGMRQEAHFRESLQFHGEWVDDAVFGLLAREWPGPGGDSAGIVASR